jgi:hypothetical protein
MAAFLIGLIGFYFGRTASPVIFTEPETPAVFAPA